MSKLDEWLKSKDSYGTRVVGDWEAQLILERLLEVEPELKIVDGNLVDNTPNEILIDITHLRIAGGVHKEGKKILISLAHYLRPCPCSGCAHDWQHECYLADCACCTDDCT